MTVSEQPKSPLPIVPQPDGAQRREAPRKMFRSKARFISDGTLHLVRTLDVSTGGLSVVAETKQAKDAVCMIELLLPMPNLDTVVVHAWVRVVYVLLSPNEGGFKLGLQFKDLNAKDKNAIDAFVRA